MLKNISNTIDFCEKIKIMRELHCDEKYINGQTSDFEVFDEWERIACLAAGHRELSAYRDQLKKIELPFLKFGEYSRKSSCKRWALANGGYYENAPVGCYAVDEFNREKMPSEEPICEFDIDKAVSKYVIDCIEYSELVEKISAEIFSEKNIGISIQINTDNCEFNRPDPYSAKCVFEAIKRGEKYNKSQALLLAMQMLAELLYRNESGRIQAVHFRAEGNIDAASAASKYLFARNLLKGEIVIDVLADADPQTLSLLSEEIYPTLKLVPSIFASDALSLERFFLEFPIGACRADPSLDREMLREVLSRICDNKEHSEYLYGVLFDYKKSKND